MPVTRSALMPPFVVSALLCHHTYITSVVIATDKLFVYSTLIMMAPTTLQLQLGSVCLHLYFIRHSLIRVYVAYLCGKQIGSNIFKLIPFRALSSLQTFLYTCSSSRGAIFHTRSISLGESHSAIVIMAVCVLRRPGMH